MQVDNKRIFVKRPFRTLFGCMAFAAGLTATLLQDRNADLCSLLPPDATLNGWSQTDTARIYEGDDLFSFIDGGAVLFFEYGFDRVLAAEYENKSGATINLEIYKMKDAGAAYGIYSVRTSDRGLVIGIGQEGTQHADYIMFWKGDCYVSVAGSDSTRACRDGVEAIARAVDRRLAKTGIKPLILESLPQEQLLKARYVRGTLSLSTVLPLVGEEMSGMIDGVAGSYEHRLLFLLRYASPEQSERTMDRSLVTMKNGKRFSNYRSDGEIAFAKSPDGRVLCLARRGSYFIVAVSTDEAIAGNSIKSLLQSNKFR
jgi:hypothetical protein